MPVFYRLVSLGCLSLVLENASAFETPTHAVITKLAFDRSELAASSPDSIVQHLGLPRHETDYPFSTYWEAVPQHRYFRPVEGPLMPGAITAEPEPLEACNMGLFLHPRTPPAFRVFQNVVASPATDLQVYPVANWIVRGVVREDDQGSLIETGEFFGIGVPELCRLHYRATPQGLRARFARHFFDPTTGLGLSYVRQFQRSVDWALGHQDAHTGNQGPDEMRENSFSYVDARNAYWGALTLEGWQSPGAASSEARLTAAGTRLALWATSFRAVGNVVHLIQDAAQPQHTRHDRHGGPGLSEQQKAFESYTNARILGLANNGQAEVETYIRAFFTDTSTFDPPIPGSYPAVEFSTPARFFSTKSGPTPPDVTAGGIADYSNRGFFTGGTLPPESTSDTHVLPPRSIDSAHGYAEENVPCKHLLNNPNITAVTCSHFVRDVPDAVAPSYVDHLPSGFETKPPLAAESVWRGVLPTIKATLGPEELMATANLAIPRAIGYTAGFINYFFRGKLKVSAPPGGVFAVLDHGTPHEVVEGFPVRNGAIFGFTKVRLRVQNDTYQHREPRGTMIESGTGREVPQTMGPALGPTKLVAIARYHRSACYRPDLQGEIVERPESGGASTVFVPSGCNIAANRTPVLETSVSTAIVVGEGGSVPAIAGSTCTNLNRGPIGGPCDTASALLEFDFTSDPIPLNATDLFIQVAYRGPIGEERDGIAVGSIDVREPSFLSLSNDTDYYLYQGAIVPTDSVPFPPRPAAPEAQRLDKAFLCIDGQRVATHVQETGFFPRGFLRIAAIMDDQVHTITSRRVFGTGAFRAGSDPMLANQRQSDKDRGGNYAVEPVPYFRGTAVGAYHRSTIFSDLGSEPTPEHFVTLANTTPPLQGPAGAGISLPIATSVDFPNEFVGCGP